MADGRAVLARLAEPFRSEEVQFKIQTNPKDGDDMALVVAYVDARAVSGRLNEVAGLEWQSAFMPSATGGGVECRLTVMGATRADVGVPSDNEADKGGYSDALKRAAVHFGIAAYLYDFPKVKAKVKKLGRSTFIDFEAQKELAQLVEAIHNEAEKLPAFSHIKVSGYRRLHFVYVCGECGGEVAPAYNRTARGLSLYTREKYGKPLCATCATQAAQANGNGGA
jgi:hypothetical protein